MASFPVNGFTEGAWKSNKIIKIIMWPEGGKVEAVDNPVVLPNILVYLVVRSSQPL